MGAELHEVSRARVLIAGRVHDTKPAICAGPFCLYANYSTTHQKRAVKDRQEVKVAGDGALL